MVIHLTRLHSAWAELRPGPGLPGCRDLDRMTSEKSVLPASSGYQSQSAACASAGSAQRSPSWSCGGHPRAGQQTAAAPRTGEKERQKAADSGQRQGSGGFPGPRRLSIRHLEAPPSPTLFSIKSIPIFPGSALTLCLQLHITVGPFFLDPIFCPSPLTPGSAFSTYNSLLLKLLCVCFSCTTSHIPSDSPAQCLL